MKPKKNPKNDLSKKSGLFFVLGLMLVLGLAFVALEWKTYDKGRLYVDRLNVEDGIDEDVPVFRLETTPPPPPPPVIPQVIEIAKDDDPIIETVIDAIEPNPDTEILDPSKLKVEEIEEEVNVIWETIEEVPIFPGCENVKDKRACFNEMMQKHIQKHFRYPELAQEMGIQGRVSTQFEIKSDGSIGTIQKRGPHKILEEEAIRILSKLPKMTPGQQRGTPVKVSFSIPINFVLQ